MPNFALHVGLNRVDPDAYGGWEGKLSGCVNDALTMLNISRINNYSGMILLDQEATAVKFLACIKHMAALTLPGYTVMISYSGHGGQVFDTSGDEADKMDETLCLYDGMITDDQFHRALSEFKRGVRVIVISDSCHSGTVVRAADFPKMAWTIKSAPLDVCRVAKLAIPSSPSLKRPKISASVLLLSGCKDNQYSYDGAQNGLFTEKIHRLYTMQQFEGNYAQFRKVIVALMPPEQTPKLLTMGAANKAFAAGQVFSCS